MKSEEGYYRNLTSFEWFARPQRLRSDSGGQPKFSDFSRQANTLAYICVEI
jgi:hypothetical protein